MSHFSVWCRWLIQYISTLYWVKYKWVFIYNQFCTNRLLVSPWVPASVSCLHSIVLLTSLQSYDFSPVSSFYTGLHTVLPDNNRGALLRSFFSCGFYFTQHPQSTHQKYFVFDHRSLIPDSCLLTPAFPSLLQCRNIPFRQSLRSRLQHPAHNFTRSGLRQRVHKIDLLRFCYRAEMCGDVLYQLFV